MHELNEFSPISIRKEESLHQLSYPDEYIANRQFLKIYWIHNQGQAKMVPQKNIQFVDGSSENRRGRKLIRIHVSKYLMKVFLL